MHRILAVLVGLILINLLPCAFAQNNLNGPSDKQRLVIAQQNAGDSANDRAFWDSVKDSKNPDELKAYLEQFPTGIFALLARTRIKALENGSIQDIRSNTAVTKVTGPQEIRRDGRYIAYDNGTVLDTERNLMWASKDNGDGINWLSSKRYCENYRGGGYTDWRMPTQDELAGLYDSSKSYQAGEFPGLLLPKPCFVHLTELIKLTSYAIWASEIRDSLFGASANLFHFDEGNRRYGPQSNTHTRVLPVRSSK